MVARLSLSYYLLHSVGGMEMMFLSKGLKLKVILQLFIYQDHIANHFFFLKPPSHIWLDYSLEKFYFNNQNFEVFHELNYFTFSDCKSTGYLINKHNYSLTKLT